MTEHIPAEVFCLAESLADEIIERGWTTEDVAIRMNTSRGPAMDLFIVDLLMCVQDDGLLIDEETFDGLARAFDVDPQYFRNLHAVWQRWPDRRNSFEPPGSIFGPTSRQAIPSTH